MTLFMVSVLTVLVVAVLWMLAGIILDISVLVYTGASVAAIILVSILIGSLATLWTLALS